MDLLNLKKRDKALEDFTETFTTVLTGMHSDMNQYRREVEAMKRENALLENRMKEKLEEARKLERTNLEIKKEIEGSVKELKGIQLNIERERSQLEFLSNKAKEVYKETSSIAEVYKSGLLRFPELEKELHQHKVELSSLTIWNRVLLAGLIVLLFAFIWLS